MKIIGLTGSIAMGKSEVANVFRQANVPVFDSDAAVHALYNSKKGADLIREFAPQVVTKTAVDRAALAKLVVENPAVLTRLEPVIHSEIKRQRDAFIKQAAANGTKFVVLDIPLLFETNATADVDLIILVSSPADAQYRRAMLRPGMTEERLKLILARQMPDEDKRLRADIIIENDASIADLQRKTRELIEMLQIESPPKNA